MAKDALGRVRRAPSNWSADEGDPGALNELVVIKEPSAETRTPTGDVVPVFTAITTVADGKVWANVEELGGDEPQQGQQTQSRVTHRVRIRYLAGLTTRMLLEWRGRTLGITGIKDGGGVREFLWLMCSEKFTATPARGY